MLTFFILIFSFSSEFDTILQNNRQEAVALGAES